MQTKSQHLWSVRALLLCLILACLLPGVIGAVVLFFHEYRDGRLQFEKDTTLTVRALVETVDSQLVKAQVAVQSLATSRNLGTGDFAAFHRQARELLQNTRIGTNIVLSDASGQQILNTLRPFGEPLPRHGNPHQLEQVFATGQPVISDVFIGAVTHYPLVSIDVPVLFGGKVMYDLSIAMAPEHLTEMLRSQRLPPDWVAGIFDRTGTLAARTHAPERFVGQKGSPELVEQLVKIREGVLETVTREGIPVISIYSRSPYTNWSVAIGVPRHSLESQLVRTLSWLGLGIAAMFAASVCLAWYVGGQIARSVRALKEPAMALGAGGKVNMPRVQIKETHEVARAIRSASELLDRRTRALEEARRSYQHQLEQQVAERTAALQAANKELQAFTYAASHDLKAPLGRINSFSTLLEKSCRDRLSGDNLMFLDFIRQNATRMTILIDDLLAHARIEQDKLNLQAVNLKLAIQAVIGEKEGDIRERSTELALDLPEVHVWADPLRLNQVLLNLVENALKYSAKGKRPHIEIGAAVEEEHCRLWVRDNGIGFRMDYHDQIFELFRRLHTYDEFPGSGIGLALVKKAMEHMGGRVWAESEPNKGATFYLELQLADLARQPIFS